MDAFIAGALAPDTAADPGGRDARTERATLVGVAAMLALGAAALFAVSRVVRLRERQPQKLFVRLTKLELAHDFQVLFRSLFPFEIPQQGRFRLGLFIQIDPRQPQQRADDEGVLGSLLGGDVFGAKCRGK